MQNHNSPNCVNWRNLPNQILSCLNYKFIVDFIHCYITVNKQQGIHEQTSPCLFTGVMKYHFPHVMANRISQTLWNGKGNVEKNEFSACRVKMTFLSVINNHKSYVRIWHWSLTKSELTCRNLQQLCKFWYSVWMSITIFTRFCSSSMYCAAFTLYIFPKIFSRGKVQFA